MLLRLLKNFGMKDVEAVVDAFPHDDDMTKTKHYFLSSWHLDWNIFLWKEAWNKTSNILGGEWYETVHLPERQWNTSNFLRCIQIKMSIILEKEDKGVGFCDSIHRNEQGTFSFWLQFWDIFNEHDQQNLNHCP